MADLFSLALTAILINNIILTKFFGMCPFLGVSKKTSSAVGMGVAVIFVIMGASIITWCLYNFVLVKLEIEYMQLITFILVIASFVQFTEMFIKKFSPALYKSLGIYLPLITTNCAVLYVAQDNITQNYDFIHMLVNSFSVPFGFLIVLYLFSCIRERLDLASTPNAWKGNPIALVTAGLMALAFSGFAGLV